MFKLNLEDSKVPILLNNTKIDFENIRAIIIPSSHKIILNNSTEINSDISCLNNPLSLNDINSIIKTESIIETSEGFNSSILNRDIQTFIYLLNEKKNEIFNKIDLNNVFFHSFIDEINCFFKNKGKSFHDEIKDFNYNITDVLNEKLRNKSFEHKGKGCSLLKSSERNYSISRANFVDMIDKKNEKINSLNLVKFNIIEKNTANQLIYQYYRKLILENFLQKNNDPKCDNQNMENCYANNKIYLRKALLELNINLKNIFNFLQEEILLQNITTIYEKKTDSINKLNSDFSRFDETIAKYIMDAKKYFFFETECSKSKNDVEALMKKLKSFTELFSEIWNQNNLSCDTNDFSNFQINFIKICENEINNLFLNLQSTINEFSKLTKFTELINKVIKLNNNNNNDIIILAAKLFLCNFREKDEILSNSLENLCINLNDDSIKK